MRKIFIWGFFLFLLLALNSLQAQAATNKTQCKWNEDTGQCYQWIDCNPGCVPPVLNCPSMGPNVCKLGPAPQNCNCTGPGTLQCSWSPSSQTRGTCRRTGDCGSGYTPSPANDSCLAFDIDQASCEAKNPGTCIPATIPQPSPITPGGGVQPEPCDSDGDGVDDGIKTALGCIPTEDASIFVAWFLKFAIGIGGGIAFLLMLFGAFQILTSSGDPERLKAGKELIGSALAGLLMIIFSLFLLRLIGIEILQIPGLQ